MDKSVKFMSPEWKRQNNLNVLRYRCRSFLNPKDGETHGPWVKGSDNLYVGLYNIVASDDGEDYSVMSELEKISKGKKIDYRLKFEDIKELVFDDQSYRPLRQLGKLVFG